MILLLLCVFIGGFALGYVTSLLAKGWPASRPVTMNDVDHVPDTFDGPLWIDKHPRGTRPELVQRVVDLERARHEYD